MRRTLGGRYEVGEVLGRGGMATVYRAGDTVLGRPVAVKVLADRYAGDRRFVERFRREAQASARLNHPNIVSVYDTGDEDGAHYIVMELVEGETLAEALSRGHLSPERSARIATEMASALQAAHDEGIVHRDVKPGNVMLTRDGAVKVMDFGIARAAEEDQLTQTGMVLGTASYLSPEQSRGAPVDARSDVYSLGCVLREMLTGRPPFTAETPVSIAYKHVNEQPLPPSADDDSIPPELDGVVMRALEKEPGRRFPTAAAFAAALGDAAAGVPTEPIAPQGDGTAVLPVAPEPPARPRRWPTAAAFLAAFLIAALVTTALLGGEDGEGRRGARRQGERQSGNTPPQVTDVASALAHLESVVEQAVVAEAMEAGLAEAVLGEAGKAAEEYEKGSLEKALEHLVHADDRVTEGLGAGDVLPNAAEATQEAIALLASAMQADPPDVVVEEPEAPPDEGEGEDEGDGGSGEGGPGNSENAPGHNKDKDKDKDEDDD